MKKLCILFIAMLLLVRFNACPKETVPELRIVRMNEMSELKVLEYGASIPVGISIQNMSPTETFQGDILLTLYRNIPWDEEFGCGGLDSQEDSRSIALAPREIMNTWLTFLLCRPGNYFLKAVLESFPSDHIAGNDEKEKLVPLLWEEFTDLGVDPDPAIMPKAECWQNQGYLTCGFGLWNVGNVPINLGSWGPELTVTLTQPNGEVEQIFHNFSSWLLSPHTRVYYFSWWEVQEIGKYQLKFLIDPDDLVPEVNEENNRSVMTFQVESF